MFLHYFSIAVVLGFFKFENRDYMRLVSYDDWDEFEEIIENYI
jgi:hypothetical protein